jgi:hypothetical protein
MSNRPSDPSTISFDPRCFRPVSGPRRETYRVGYGGMGIVGNSGGRKMREFATFASAEQYATDRGMKVFTDRRELPAARVAWTLAEVSA